MYRQDKQKRGKGERAYRDAAALDRRLYGAEARRLDALAGAFELLSGGRDYMRKVYFGTDPKMPLHALLSRFNSWNQRR